MSMSNRLLIQRLLDFPIDHALVIATGPSVSDREVIHSIDQADGLKLIRIHTGYRETIMVAFCTETKCTPAGALPYLDTCDWDLEESIRYYRRSN